MYKVILMNNRIDPKRYATYAEAEAARRAQGGREVYYVDAD